jgi:predicted nucleic acid-binding protein
MLAIDTNIVVRYIAGDGGDEFTRAIDIIENNRVSIALTVMLETEWVLRDVYEIPRGDVLSAFAKLFGLPTVSIVEPGVLRKAMTLAGSGLDFADALHVAQVGERDTFVTFDKALAKRASRRGDSAVKLA